MVESGLRSASHMRWQSLIAEELPGFEHVFVEGVGAAVDVGGVAGPLAGADVNLVGRKAR